MNEKGKKTYAQFGLTGNLWAPKIHMQPIRAKIELLVFHSIGICGEGGSEEEKMFLQKQLKNKCVVSRTPTPSRMENSEKGLEKLSTHLIINKRP